MTALAEQQLSRIKALCDQTGFKYVEIPHFIMGVGIAVGFGGSEYVVLAVMPGQEAKLVISSGLLKDINRDRLAALDAANSLTRDNTLFPVYVHDADAGWSLIVQQTQLVDIMVEVPHYFSLILQTMPQVATAHRKTLEEKGQVGGVPWLWSQDDTYLLLVKSMM